MAKITNGQAPFCYSICGRLGSPSDVSSDSFFGSSVFGQSIYGDEGRVRDSSFFGVSSFGETIYGEIIDF